MILPSAVLCHSTFTYCRLSHIRAASSLKSDSLCGHVLVILFPFQRDILNFLREGELPHRDRVRAVHREAQYYSIGPLLDSLEDTQPLTGEKVRQAFLDLLPYYRGNCSLSPSHADMSFNMYVHVGNNQNSECERGIKASPIHSTCTIEISSVQTYILRLLKAIIYRHYY